MYYDCTNCFFDTSGGGHTQAALETFELKAIRKFELNQADIIVCTDAGPDSLANNRFNSVRRHSNLKPSKTCSSDRQGRHYLFAPGASSFRAFLSKDRMYLTNGGRMPKSERCLRWAMPKDFYAADAKDHRRNQRRPIK